MEGDSTQATIETLFDIPATLETPCRTFTIVKGETAPTIDDPDAIHADEIIGSEFDPKTFDDLDRLIAVKAALARHHKEVAEARLADAKGYEAQLQGLLRKYEHLVPAPAPDKAHKTSTGVYSSGKYRFQPDRATQYSFADKEEAKAAGMTTVYEATKIDLNAVKAYEDKHGISEVPGISRIEPSAVSFKPMK